MEPGLIDVPEHVRRVEVREVVRVFGMLQRPFGGPAPFLVAVVYETETVADLVGERRETAIPPRSGEPCPRGGERLFIKPRPAGRSEVRDTARLVAVAANVVDDHMNEVGAVFLPGEQDPIEDPVRVGPGTIGVLVIGAGAKLREGAAEHLTLVGVGAAGSKGRD